MQNAPQFRGRTGDIAMSIVEKRSPARIVDPAAVDGELSATTSIGVAFVVALILYLLGAAVLQQDIVAGAPQHANSADILFHGP
jgi:hypothetical protein